MSKTPRLFPLHLTPFENFMVVDDRPRYPMTFSIELTFSGRIDRDVFERSLEDARQRHPLLQSLIRPAKRGKECWVNSKGLKPRVSWGGIDDPLDFAHPEGEYLDLSEEVGLRVWVRHDDERAVVTMQVHHCVCDGIGGYQFVGDLLWFYATYLGVTLDALPPMDPQDLRHRWKASFDLSHFERVQNRWRTDLAEAARLALRRTSALKPNRESVGVVGDAGYPGFKEYVFEKQEYKALRQDAISRAQTPNDAILQALFASMFQWNRRRQFIPWPQSLCVMVPLDLRDENTPCLPASNILTNALIRRRLRQRDLATLGESLRTEMAMIKSDRLHTRFTDIIIGGYAYPRLLKAVIGGERCLATAFLSNMGNPIRHFRASFPNERGVLQCGNLRLEGISGVPPMRANTRTTVAVITYRRFLKIVVRCDPHYFSSDDTQQFLDLYVQNLREPASAFN